MANEVNSGAECLREGQEAGAKKPWHAPQLESASIAGVTEHMGNSGSDGGGSVSLS